jgi:hypothetical protein
LTAADRFGFNPDSAVSYEEFRLAKKLIVDWIFGHRRDLTLSPVSTAAQLESPGITY